MKESELRSLIESEIRSILTEKFASKNMTKAFKRLDSYDKKMFNALSNKYKIAWDVINDSSVKHVKNPSSIKVESDTLVLWFTNSNKVAGPEGDWNSLDVNKGLLAVTHGKESLSLGANVVNASKPGKASQSGESGNSSKYFNSFKRIAAFADEAYVVYYGTAMGHNRVGNIQITRAQQKSGALALTSSKEALRDNKRRYESKLKAIAAKLGVEGASKFMDKIYALFESEIKKKTDLLKKGTWDASWTTGYQTARRTFENATDIYQRLLEEIAAHKKVQGDKWEDKWFASTKANKIKEIKEQYLKLKKELDKHVVKPNQNESINESADEWTLYVDGKKIKTFNSKKAAVTAYNKVVNGNDSTWDKVTMKVGSDLYESTTNESKPDLVDMMRKAVSAVKITKQPTNVAKAYYQSLAKELKRNAKDYVDYDQDDWVEDLENWIADRG